ncbi:MAG: alpha/beta fold hydrolase [Myxococcota bacterium]
MFEPTASPRALLFCFPGGGTTRAYFDLDVPGRSFARALAARGFAVAAIDSLGWGGSARPRDGFALLPWAIARGNALAVEALVRERGPDGAHLPRIGVGHSLGALLAIVQQAEHETFDALVLLGVGGRGVRQVLTADELGYVDRPDAVRRDLVALARARSGGEAWSEAPRAKRAAEVLGPMPDAAAHAAMRAVRCAIPSVASLFSLIPGSSRPFFERVRVPVFLGLGERDIAGPPHEVVASFPASADVCLHVMPGAGHAHFAFPGCVPLFDRVAHWLAGPAVRESFAARARAGAPPAVD